MFPPMCTLRIFLSFTLQLLYITITLHYNYITSLILYNFTGIFIGYHNSFFLTEEKNKSLEKETKQSYSEALSGWQHLIESTEEQSRKPRRAGNERGERRFDHVCLFSKMGSEMLYVFRASSMFCYSVCPSNFWPLSFFHSFNFLVTLSFFTETQLTFRTLKEAALLEVDKLDGLSELLVGFLRIHDAVVRLFSLAQSLSVHPTVSRSVLLAIRPSICLSLRLSV